MQDKDDVTVVYTVKELLGRLDHKIDVLTEKIDSRFDDHEARLRKLEESAVTDDALENARVNTRNTMFKALGVCTAVLSLVVAGVNYFL